MTFLPQVLTKDDPNNSTPNSINPGNVTQTTGYNSLIITITGATGSCSIEVQYSNDTDTSNFSTFYMDSILTGSAFIKSYPILKNYYRIKFTGNANSVQSRLSTQSYQSNTTNTINTFENSIENTMDAFGKLRVSNPNTLLDIRVPGQDASGLGTTGATGYLQNDIQICYGVSGAGGVGATAYKICNNSQTDIFVNGNFTFINQSRKYCTYQPGKSLLIMASGILDARAELKYGTDGATGNSPGMKSRVGYFDQYNGLYFEYDSANGCSICIKSKGDLKYYSPIGQTGWNIDQMKGNGPSGLTLDFTKAQLFVIDLEWLGVGRIRFGFYAYGRIQYCHEILNINQISVGPYTYNINLPLRYELQGKSGATGAMIQVCSTVISEGGYNPAGKPFSISSGPINVNNSETVILMLKGGNTNGNFYHQSIIPSGLNILTSSNNDIFSYKLTLYFAGATGTNGWSDVNNLSVCQYSTTNGTIYPGPAGSIVVDQGYFQGRLTSSFSNLADIFTSILQINSDINNVSDILVLTARDTISNGSANVYATINWQEIY
jgi:hypothetical protein